MKTATRSRFRWNTRTGRWDKIVNGKRVPCTTVASCASAGCPDCRSLIAKHRARMNVLKEEMSAFPI